MPQPTSNAPDTSDWPVYSPAPEHLLTEDDLRAWLEAMLPALHDAGCSRFGLAGEINPAAATVKRVRAEEHRVKSGEGGYVVRQPPRLELRLRVAAPTWVLARTLELRLSGTGGCGFSQGRGQWKSTVEVMDWLSKHHPRWKVPPQGALPFAVYLREKNGWEGESWSYYFPIAAEAALRDLVGALRASPGRDMRVTPFDPPSLATFGSWSARLGYIPEWRARKLCATSRCGYMPYHNWAGDETNALVDLVARARRRKMLRQSVNDSPGVDVYKGCVRLVGSRGRDHIEVNLA